MIYLSHKNGHFDHEQDIDQRFYKSINCAEAPLYSVSKIDIKQNFNTQFYFNFRGTIVPSEWKSITTKDGKKLSRGALELYAIIVSWHNYKKIKDKNTGKIALVPKFEGDELRKNYEYFTKELNRSQEQVRRYFAELKAANLVSMELRTVWHKYWKYPHTLCIKLNKEATHFTKGQGVDYKAINDKSFTSNDASASDIISNLDNAELNLKDLDLAYNSVKDVKKIWAPPHKKVGFAPQKSGGYIENNNSKTNKIRSDLVISDFLKTNLSLSSINFRSLANQQNSLYQVFQIKTNFSEKLQTTIQESYQKVDQLNQSNPLNFSTKHDAIGQGGNRNSFDAAVMSIASVASITKNLGSDQPLSVNHLDYLTDYNKLNPKPIDSNYSNHSSNRNPLLSFHPLSEEDAIYLRKSSGRPFNLRYINMLLLNLASKKPDHRFYNKELLLSYMTTVLIREKRDAYLVNNETFNFRLKPDSIEYKTNQKKKYLNAIELSRETNILTKIKRRIIGLFNEDDAYNIITNCHLPYLTDNYNLTQYIIEAPNSITKTESQREKLTQAVQEVLGQTVEVIFKEQKEPTKDKPTKLVLNLGQGLELIGQGDTSYCAKGIDLASTTSSSPLWQKIRECLKQRYGDAGDAIDKSWFSKLDIELNPKNNKINIKCPTNFIRGWIEQNYIDAIENAISDIGKTSKELLPDIDTSSRGYKWLECST